MLVSVTEHPFRSPIIWKIEETHWGGDVIQSGEVGQDFINPPSRSAGHPACAIHPP